MRILVIHNTYQHAGGEDAVVAAELALLRNHGHNVAVYKRHNDELKLKSKLFAAANAMWSMQSVREIAELCEHFQPNLIHAHNTFPLISPSLNWVAARRQIPMVHTLHNFRLLCPQGNFLRDGNICEDCLGAIPWRAMTRRCYRSSAIQSAVSASVLSVHRGIGSYHALGTHYIALSEFCRNKFITGGFASEHLSVKPNFVFSEQTPSWTHRQGAAFVGRLSPEKGLELLIEALRQLPAHPIKVVGTGPQNAIAKEYFQHQYLGYQSHENVLRLLNGLQFLVAPSTCYETFGLSIVEAFSCGTPVIASRLGTFAELVKDGVTGLLFNPGDATDLANKIAWAFAHPNEMLTMGQAARLEYEMHYTPERNYNMLIEIYAHTIQRSRYAKDKQGEHLRA